MLCRNTDGLFPRCFPAVLAVGVIALAILQLFGCAHSRSLPHFDENAPVWTVIENGKAHKREPLYPKVLPEGYHANRLLEGDFRFITVGVGFSNSTLPYHLQRLIDIGEDATPVLIAMLEFDTKSKITFLGRPEMVFDTGLHGFEPWESNEQHEMTVGDMAAYALRSLYRKDFGFRSYRSEDECKVAINKWTAFWNEKTSAPGSRDGYMPNIR